MKIKKVAATIAIFGLAMLSARAQVSSPPYLLNFKLSALVPAINSPLESTRGTGLNYTHTISYVALKVKITNKEILSLLATEAGTTFPLGAKLMGYGGDVYVADASGTNFLYAPDFTYGIMAGGVEAGTGTTVSTDSSTKSSLTYSQTSTRSSLGGVRYVGATQNFEIDGLLTLLYSAAESSVATVAGTTDSAKFKISFALSGAGACFIAPAGDDGIISGSVSGTKSFSTKEIH